MENIITAIKSTYPISDSSLELLISNLTHHIIPKKQLIIKEGRFDRDVYFIERGITRSHCIIDGNDVTTWFSKEGDMTFGLLDLYRGQPGFECVTSLEECEVYSIPIDRLNQLYQIDIDIANWSRVAHQECVLALQLHRIDILSLSASERHTKLLERLPNIYSRVNLGYIASFLGITLPTLSKIRAGVL